MAVTKVKTSVSLSAEVVEALDRVANDRGERSALIERAVVEFLARRRREERDARERVLLDAMAPERNAEMEELLELQADVFAELDAEEDRASRAAG